MFGDARKHKKALEEKEKAYKHLRKLKNNPDFQAYFELLLDAAASKMVNAFTGDAISNWDEFCKVRGEVQAYLYPIQEVSSADQMIKHAREKLDQYYGEVDQQ